MGLRFPCRLLADHHSARSPQPALAAGSPRTPSHGLCLAGAISQRQSIALTKPKAGSVAGREARALAFHPCRPWLTPWLRLPKEAAPMRSSLAADVQHTPLSIPHPCRASPSWGSIPREPGQADSSMATNCHCKASSTQGCEGEGRLGNISPFIFCGFADLSSPVQLDQLKIY